jgi:hypothetical protein
MFITRSVQVWSQEMQYINEYKLKDIATNFEKEI